MGEARVGGTVRPGRSPRACLATTVAVAAFALTAAPAGAAPVGEGMLRPDDVGLATISEPHTSTVVAVDVVQADTCEPGESPEREGRVVSFAQQPDNPASGAQLNQVVFDLDSAADAKAFFAEVRANESARAECGSTQKATDLTFTKGPEGVGAARFTVTADEQIGGTTREVTSVELLQGTHVAEVVFIDWGRDLPSVKKVAKQAAARLA